MKMDWNDASLDDYSQRHEITLKVTGFALANMVDRARMYGLTVEQYAEQCLCVGLNGENREAGIAAIIRRIDKAEQKIVEALDS